ncbi:hypothetical protein DH2020_003097 [Rehmannia glutinosa]|uniref:MLO-like protein n=1 Tax=Rehmannia glutinosa TaxID=99300 RepID=A0ABR0XKP2_REHGL
MAGGESGRPFEFTPTWVIAVVCFGIVFISVIAERALHSLGKCFQRKNQDALFEALQKLKEELMLLGFISLLLTVFQGLISHFCIPDNVANIMLPCKMEAADHQHTAMNGRRLLAEEVSQQCSEGHVPFLSLEALHQLHIFIFVLAVVYVIFCASTMVLGGIKFMLLMLTYKSSWDGQANIGENLGVVSWILVLVVVCCDLLAYEHSRMAYIFLALLLIVGAKLEHIITELAKDAAERAGDAEGTRIRPSDELFWFHRPALVLYLIHFILFQNSFEIAFFLWIWSTYGFRSCIMETLDFIIPRIVIGIIVQVLCSYSTLPLYALVSQMGSMFKQTVFDQFTKDLLLTWASDTKRGSSLSNGNGTMSKLTTESTNPTTVAQQPVVEEGNITPSEIELSCPNNSNTPYSLNKY